MKRIIFIPALDKDKAIAKGNYFTKETIKIDNEIVETELHESDRYYNAILVDDEAQIKKGDICFDEETLSLVDYGMIDDCYLKVLAISNPEIFLELPELTKDEILKYTTA